MNPFCSSPGENRTRYEKCRGAARKMREWGAGAGRAGRGAGGRGFEGQRALPDTKVLTAGFPALHTVSLASSKRGSVRRCSSGPLVPLDLPPPSPPPVSPTLPPLFVFLEQPSLFLPQKRHGSNKPTGLIFLGSFTCPGVLRCPGMKGV